MADAFSAMTTTRPYRKALRHRGGDPPPRGRGRQPARPDASSSPSSNGLRTASDAPHARLRPTDAPPLDARAPTSPEPLERPPDARRLARMPGRPHDQGARARAPSSDRRPGASRSPPGCARPISTSSSARSTSSASAARCAVGSIAATSPRSCCGARRAPARRASPGSSPGPSAPASRPCRRS